MDHTYWINNKNQERYKAHSFSVIDCTANADRNMVLYLDKEGHLYVRDYGEFMTKFTHTKDDSPLPYEKPSPLAELWNKAAGFMALTLFFGACGAAMIFLARLAWILGGRV